MTESTAGAMLSLPPLSASIPEGTSSLRPQPARALSNLSSRSSSPHPSSPSTLATSPFRETGPSDSERDTTHSLRLHGDRSSASLAPPTPTQAGDTGVKSLKKRPSFFEYVRQRSSKQNLKGGWESTEHATAHQNGHCHQQRSGSPQPLLDESDAGSKPIVAQYGGTTASSSGHGSSMSHHGVPQRMSSRDFRQHANTSSELLIPSETSPSSSSAAGTMGPHDSESHLQQPSIAYSDGQIPSGSAQVSMREIRRAAASKLDASQEAPPRRLSMLVPPGYAAASASSSPSSSRRPSATGLAPLSPRSPVMSRLSRGSDEAAEDDDSHDEAEGSTARNTAARRRLTMMDFLSTGESSGPSDPRDVPTSAASTSATPTSSRSGPFESLRTSPTRIRQRPKSLLVDPSAHNEAGAEPTPASTLDPFLGNRSANGFARKHPLRVDTSTYTTEAPAQASQRRTADEGVTLSVKPMTDIMTMFGSTQTSANYSLSGSVEISLPRPQRMEKALRTGVVQGSGSDRSSKTGQPVAEEPSGSLPGGVANQDGNPISSPLQEASQPDLQAPMTVKELHIAFNGYSTYADHSGRYSGIRLCEVKQDLLPAEATLPLPADLQPSQQRRGSAETSPEEPLKYEIQFDLSVPGWLPGSAYSRFGSTFYCLSATAIVLDSSGREMLVRGATRDPSSASSNTRSMGSAIDDRVASQRRTSSPLLGLVTSPSEVRGGRSGRSSPTGPSDGFNELVRTVSETGKVQLQPVPKQKSKPSWLTQKAKAISLKARATSSSAASGSGSVAAGTRGGTSPVGRITIPRTDQAGTRKLPDGTYEVKSKKQLIILRRCRDVVPVPVARMAILGDNVPAGAQDLPRTVLPVASRILDSNTVVAPPTAAPATMLEPAQAAVQPARESEPATEASHPIRAVSQPPPIATETAATVAAAPAVSAPGADISAPVTESNTESVPDIADATPPAAASIPPNPVPSPSTALNAPFDPAKAPSISQAPDAPARTSSTADLLDQSGPRTTTSSSTDGGVPMRHFLHRPILHPPVDSGIQEGQGLPFSLTISVPSHIQVQGADVLTFGVQVEVGRSFGWAKVRELGGLRLRDMELVCLQTERHTSVPSRTFCSTFPVPAEPKIAAADLPIVPEYTPPINNRRVASSQEARVRIGYDPAPIATYLSMAEAGNPAPVENNEVERVRAGVVGPPPNFKANKQRERIFEDGSSKGKERRPEQAQRSSNARALSDEPPPGRASGSRRVSAATSGATSSGRMTSSASTSQGLAAGNSVDGVGSTSRRPSTRAAIPALYGVPSAPASVPRGQSEANDHTSATRPAEGLGAGSGAEGGASSGAEAASPDGRRSGRGRRAYEATIRGLSAFATAMLEAGFEEAGPSTPYAPLGGQHDSFPNGDQPRASYSFQGDDGHGVDLTKGRVRMTVNLPLVSSSATMARREASPQLLPDYESPHMRVRHKLKVKLGFGFGPKPLAGDGEWGQSLVMCVPVRFTDAPPKEISDQFAPMPITMTSAGEADAGVIQPIISMADPNSAPVLPAYTQLFRDDGSRLNEAEDLPAYPGPRRGGSAANGSGGVAMRPTLSSRGSVTGPPRLTRRGTYGEVGRGGARPTLSARGSVTGPLLPRASTNNGRGVGDEEDDDELELPLDNSLAPEQVVDEALRNITDPDESRAEMREQEREMAELESERDLMLSAAALRDEETRANTEESSAEGDGEGEGEDEPAAIVRFESPQGVDEGGDEVNESFLDADEVDRLTGTEAGLTMSPSTYEARTRQGRGEAGLSGLGQ
ncbi:hypothetical protein BCV69DRAFT_283148 [Microstroma glucosiphilum]|uniref:Uncharacterized protein n=1 Tax=Pseudomicrostroma glucosiphilum TaxID=1684307 RepID=A0A316U4Z3_9BASI|nr:hypothetical protein BCV69DRAFT_283148 [Pseudomicrostroma glucosiphilum]PWN20270.1 hypothetical protein BCV69DRAFT_283148 [Pseudomicrostroma glucosiphilum]